MWRYRYFSVSDSYLNDKANNLDDKADMLDDKAEKFVTEAKETEHKADNCRTEALVSFFVVALVCRCYVAPGTSDWTVTVATATCLLFCCHLTFF